MKLGKKRRTVISIASLLFVVLIIWLTGILSWAERKSYDYRIKTSAKNRMPSDEISLVLIDQESLDWAKESFNWSWPWPRESYAWLTDYCARGNAASLAFDMVFSEPSVYGPEDDGAFAESSKKFGRVIQTVFYKDENAVTGTKPVPVLLESAAALGNITSLLDKEDRCARRSSVIPLKNQNEPGLSVSSYVLKNGSLDLKKIPVASKGGMFIRYVDDISKFVPYSMKEILSSELKIRELEKQFSGDELIKKIEELTDKDPDFISPYQFEDNYVFFGLYAPGLFDICATPVSASYPGVGIHLCQLDTILKGDYLHESPVLLTLLIFFICVSGGFFLGASISQAKVSSLIIKTLVMVLCCAFYNLFCYYAFVRGMILPVALPLTAFVFSYVMAVFEDYIIEGSKRRYLKTAFKQYLSPQVIDKLIANPEMLNLGGEEREITAYFSDVQGFTSISEKLSPRELTDLLNTYLSEMTDIILANGGTIDKYEGDAIIAFWGAPSCQENHAALAVKTALECQKKLSEMQNILTKTTGKPFVQRIGLNTGKAIVGNMGSRSRFDYTMMGDTVNLASRLEEINKHFGTYTMCSEETMKNALQHGCTSSFRKIARIRVVGKNESVPVYIPMELAEYESSKAAYTEFDKAVALFEKGSFLEAEKIFDDLKAEDSLSGFFASECKRLIQSAPESWDGVVTATEK